MKSKLRVITIVALVLIIFTGCEKASENKALVIGTEGTYRPYTYHDENGVLTGYDIEVAKEIFKRLDMEITFSETQWDGLLAGLETDRFDLVVNQVWRNESREEVYTLSDAYMHAGAVLIVKEDNDEIKTIEDIKNKLGAHSLTSGYAEISKEAGAEVVSVNSFSEAAENVKYERVDYTINDQDSFIQYQLSNPDSGLVGYDINSIEKVDVVFALKKENSEELSKKINEIIKELYEDGTIEKFEKQFLN